MSTKVVVKCAFGSDIRRITVEDTILSKELKKIIRKLYKIQYFRMSYVDEESDSVTISSDLDLGTAIRHCIAAENKILRLIIEETEAPTTKIVVQDGNDITLSQIQKQSTSSKTYVIIKGNDSSSIDLPPPPIKSSPSDIERFMMGNDAVEKIQRIVQETVTSQRVTSLIMENVMKMIAEEAKPEIDHYIRLDSLESSREQNETPTVGLSRSESEESSQSQSQCSVIEHNLDESVLSVPQEVHVESDEDDEEPLPLEESEVAQSQDHHEIEREEQPALAPFRSLLSLVREVVSPKPKKDAELEKTLRRLEDMGFNDREANLEVLKFHNQYKEGLDEVVEDLLIRSSQRSVPADDDVEESSSTESITKF